MLSTIINMETAAKDLKETRAGFGAGVYEAAKANSNVILLTADLAGSMRINDYMKDFADRFFNVGVAEANMIGVAAGLTIGGKIPYTTTFANFSTGRVYDQIRQSVAYSGKNVKICASHAGLTLGEDGATHQILEDIGMMKMLPHMTVIVPCDYNQTKIATQAIAEMIGPVYLRFGRPKMPNFTPVEQDFQIGKAQVLREGEDVSIIACGHMVWKALEAAEILKEKSIQAEVINMHTIKPLDTQAIIDTAAKTDCIVTAEEHQINGGLGESVARIISGSRPAPIEMVAVNDSFGESGTPAELMAKYNIDTPNIVEAAIKAIERKQ